VIESLAAQRAGDAAKIRLGPLRGNAPPPDAAPGVCDTRPTHPLDQCNRPIWYGYRACAATFDRHPDHTSHQPSPLAQLKRKKYRAIIPLLGARI